MILRRSAALAGLGALIGAAIAAGAIRLLMWWSAGLGVIAWDNAALLSGAALAGSVGMLAAVGPSRRASQIDPNNVLRAD